MESLYLIPVLVSILIALSRVHAVRGATVEGAPERVIALTIGERIRYHRVSIYSLGVLLLLGALNGMLHTPVELTAALLMTGVVLMPIRYTFTKSGLALNRVLFRRWSEFAGYDVGRSGVRLLGLPGNGKFDVRVAPVRASFVLDMVKRHLRVAAVAPANASPPVATRRRRGVLLTGVALVPIVALLLTVVPARVFAECSPDAVRDSAGVCVGAPEDLAGVTVGGGSFAVLDPDGAVDAKATAKVFSDAQKNEPFAYNLAAYVNQNRLAINFVWTLVAGFIVMFMQAGFAMVETGFCRGKNAMHVMMTNFMVYGVGMLAFWATGFALMFGGVGGAANLGSGISILDQEAHIGTWGIFGHKGFFLGPQTLDVGVAVLFLFQMVFMDTAATILTGAVAERWTWVSFLIWGVFIGGFIYPIFGNWAWGGGWLFQLKDSAIGRPYIDFAGSGVVHSVGGWAALAAAWVLGPRLGKYNRDGSSNAMPGHDINMAAIGTFILAFGWFGFNPGSSLGASGNGNLHIGMVAVVTMLAGAAASVTAMFYGKLTVGKWDPGYMINGILAGLVAITAPSGYVSPISAVVIGASAGIIVCFAMGFIENVLKIDDPVGAISVHAINGVWGIICVGIFADGTAPDWAGVGHPIKGILFGDGAQLVAQLVGAVTVIVWSFGTSFVLFSVLKALGIYRSKPEDEIAGLDLPEMGMHAYPVQEVAVMDGRLAEGILLPAPTSVMST